MIKAILTDIEGTITRISFVKEVLFPYAAKQLATFMRLNENKTHVAEQIAAVKAIINEPDATTASTTVHICRYRKCH